MHGHCSNTQFKPTASQMETASVQQGGKHPSQGSPLRRAVGRGAEGTALGASRAAHHALHTPPAPLLSWDVALLNPEPAGQRSRVHPVGGRTALRYLNKCTSETHFSFTVSSLKMCTVSVLLEVDRNTPSVLKAREQILTHLGRGRPESHCFLGTECNQQCPRGLHESHSEGRAP